MDSTNRTFSPLGQQKNIPCSHHAWPNFVFLPHYSKKTSQARALQSAHLSLPILLFPGKASPTARCSQRRNPLLLLLRTSPNQKAHSYQPWTLPQHITCIQKMILKDTSNHSFSHTEWQYVHKEFFACPFCFQGNETKFPTSQTE